MEKVTVTNTSQVVTDIQNTFPLVERNTYCNFPNTAARVTSWIYYKADDILPGSEPPTSPTGLWVGLHLPLCSAGMLLLFPLPFTALHPGLWLQLIISERFLQTSVVAFLLTWLSFSSLRLRTHDMYLLA